MKQALIIGIGNVYRGDDGAGLELAERLKERLGPIVDMAFCQGDALDLMDLWSERECVFLIDAVAVDISEVGHLFRFLPLEEKIPAILTQSSTHFFDVSQVIELAKTLGKLPQSLVFYGIGGHRFCLEAGISDDLKSVFEKVLEKIEKDMRNHLPALS